jgi:hypothetical protein
MAIKNSVEHVPLDRRICIIREDRIDIRPSRGAIIVPLFGALLSLVAFVIVGLTIDVLPVVVLALLLIPGVIVFPLSVMGLYYSLVGAHVIIDRRKSSATFQQGLVGLAVGTRELVPFGKVDCIAVEEVAWGEGESRPAVLPFELRAWDIVLVKTDGERLPLGMVVVPQEEELANEGLGRARRVAEAIGRLVGRPVQVEGAPLDREKE